jgi:hypothetical protein
MALIFIFAGLIGAATGLGGFLFDAVRNVEDILPDHDAEATTPEAATASGDAPEQKHDPP